MSSRSSFETPRPEDWQADLQPVPAFVIHWRSPVTAAKTVAAFQTSRRLEVHVIDNASPAHEIDMLRAALADDVDLLALDENIGFAGAANLAIRYAAAAGAAWFIIAAHDVDIEREGLDALLAAAEEAPHGILGPVFGEPDELAD